MPQYQTLNEVLIDRAHSPHGITFIESQGRRCRYSYGELLLRATRQLAIFRSKGLGRGSQLIILTSDNARFIEAFWACLLGGIVAVPVAGGVSAEHRHKLYRIAAKLNSPGLYTDEPTLARLQDFAGANRLQSRFQLLSEKTILCDAETPGIAGEQGDLPNLVSQESAGISENDVAFIQFSSGSTSTPKGIVLTHKNLMTNHRSIIEGCQMGEQDRLFSWMPLTHDMGLIGFHLTPVVCNAEQTLMATDVFVRRPGLWLSEVAAGAATILCSPNFGYQHVLKSFKPENHPGLDLSSVRLLFNGAEPISLSLCRQFMKTFQPFKLHEDAMFPVYGLAEASLAVTFPALDNRFNTLSIQRTALGVGETIIPEITNPGVIGLPDTGSNGAALSFVAVGKPLIDVQLMISDDKGKRLPDHTTGHIRIKGDNVTSGYYQEAELNRELISSDGWLDTGDLGFIHNGQLFITGRAKDIIFVSGQNIYPHDLEEIIVQAELVERGKLAVSSRRTDDNSEEELLVFVLHRGQPEDLLDTARALTRLLSESAGVRVHAVVPVGRIPKTTSGKVQRYLLVAALESGELTALAQELPTSFSVTEAGQVTNQVVSVDRPDVNNTAREDFAEVPVATRLLALCNARVEDTQIGLDDNLFDLGISSLTLAEIHAGIEDSWPGQVDITDLFDYPTVSELATFLESKSPAAVVA